VQKKNSVLKIKYLEILKKKRKLLIKMHRFVVLAICNWNRI